MPDAILQEQVVVDAPHLARQRLLDQRIAEHTEAFQKLVNDQDLVRVKFVMDEAPYREGEIHGLPVEVALKMLAWERAAPCDDKGEFLPLKRSVKKSGAVVAPNKVEIPQDWASLHHLQRVRLANDLRGESGVLTAEQADEIIQAELETRATRQ